MYCSEHVWGVHVHFPSCSVNRSVCTSIVSPVRLEMRANVECELACVG